MRKTLVLATVFSLVLSGFGFAAAKPACAEMMERSHMAASNCCQSSCPCTIEERTNDQAMPVSAAVFHSAESAVLPAGLSVEPVSHAFFVRSFTEISPHEFVPLYQLFSVYRI